MESEDGVEGLIGNDNILTLGIDGNAARILQEQVGSPDRPTRRHVSIIEDAPHTDIIFQSEAAFDIVSVHATGISGTDDGENHTVRWMVRHQPGILCSWTGDGAERLGIAVALRSKIRIPAGRPERFWPPSP